MNELGKFMMFGGLAIAAIGALVWSGFDKSWFGQLPGDIHIQRESFSFRFPIVTCVVISLVLTLLSWLVRK